MKRLKIWETIIIFIIYSCSDQNSIKIKAAEMKRKQHFKPNIDGNLQMKTLMKKIRSKVAYEF